MNKLVTGLMIAAMAAMPFAANAAQDENQRAMTQRIQQAKQKLAAAQAAQGAERQ